MNRILLWPRPQTLSPLLDSLFLHSRLRRLQDKLLVPTRSSDVFAAEIMSGTCANRLRRSVSSYSILSAFVRALLTISCLPTFVQVRVRKLRWKTRTQDWSFTKVALTFSELCSQSATLCGEALHNKESAGLITLKCNCIPSAPSLCLLDRRSTHTIYQRSGLVHDKLAQAFPFPPSWARD